MSAAGCRRVVLATRNPHKIRELRPILRIPIRTQERRQLIDMPETDAELRQVSPLRDTGQFAHQGQVTLGPQSLPCKYRRVP